MDKIGTSFEISFRESKPKFYNSPTQLAAENVLNNRINDFPAVNNNASKSSILHLDYGQNPQSKRAMKNTKQLM